jgi:hypothetical protein
MYSLCRELYATAPRRVILRMYIGSKAVVWYSTSEYLNVFYDYAWLRE